MQLTTFRLLSAFGLLLSAFSLPAVHAGDTSPSWIWSALEKESSNDPRYIRVPFELSDDVASATLAITADNSCEAFINGNPVATVKEWNTPFSGEVKGLVKGKNVLAVIGRNAGGQAGVLFDLAVTQKDKKTARIVSSLDARFSMKEAPDWKLPTFEGKWPGVVNIGAWNAEPWNLTAFGGAAAGQGGGPAAGGDPNDPETERASFIVDENFEVSLYASDPLIHKPIQMNFDAAGRLWLVSSSIYPQIKPGEVANDKVLILEDVDGDGKAEKTSVFADGLLIPTGIEIGDGGAYVANSTEIVHFKDTNGDGKADQKRVVLSGFGTEDTHHIVHTFRWGPDGSLYFNQSIYIHSNIETPRGTKRLGGGGVWRYRPASQELDVYCKGMCNPWGTTWDAYGQVFGTDGAGGDGVHYLIQGFTYPHFPGGGKAFPGLNPGSPKYAGVDLVSGRHLPDDWQGDIVTNDFRAHRVVRYKPSDDGSGFASKQMPDLIKTKNAAFRPIDVKMGPDGAIYIADWFNPIINHGEVDFFDPRRDRTRGRIWRVTAKNRPLVEKPKIVGAPISNLLEMLNSPEGWTRHFAKRELAARDPKDVLAAVGPWIAAQKKEQSKLEGLWIYTALDVTEPNVLGQLLKSPDANVRAGAVRVLSYWSKRLDNSFALLSAAASDESPRVRLEAVRSLAQLGTAESFEAATVALDKPTDRFLNHALWLAANDLKNVWQPAANDGKLTFGGSETRKMWAMNAVGAQAAVKEAFTKLATGQQNAQQEAQLLAQISANANPDDVGSLIKLCLPGKLNDDQAGRVLERAMRICWEKTIRPKTDAGTLGKVLEARKGHPGATGWTLRLIGVASADALRPQIAELAKNEAAPANTRRSAIAALAGVGGQESIDILKSLSTADKPFEQRRWVAISMPLLDLGYASSLAAELVAVDPAQGATEPAMTELFNEFVRRAGFPEALAKALEGKKIPEATAKIGMKSLQSSAQADSPLAATLKKAIGGGEEEKTAFSKEELAALIANVQKADPVRGEAVYRRAELSCQKCHSIGGAGGNIGPDMVSIGASAPLDYLVESLYFPNVKVKEGYHSKIVITNDGKVVTGIKLKEEDGGVTLRDAEGNEITISKGNIKRMRDGGSIMPGGLMETLKKEDGYDLLRFLGELGKPGPFAASSVPLAKKWMVLAKAPADAAAIDKVPAAEWQLNWSRVDGTLPAGVAVARTQLDVGTGGKLKLKVNGAAGLKLWVDGTAVDVKDETEIDVKPGARALTFVIDAARKDGLRVELAEVAGSAAKAQWALGK